MEYRAVPDRDMFQFDGTEEDNVAIVSSTSPSDDEEVRGSSPAEPPKKVSRVTKRGTEAYHEACLAAGKPPGVSDMHDFADWPRTIVGKQLYSDGKFAGRNWSRTVALLEDGVCVHEYYAGVRAPATALRMLEEFFCSARWT